jgi:cell wall-associated NlpC family hydrolase
MNNWTVEQALNAQLQRLLGTPYRWGGSSPLAGLDCSGLIVELGQSVGLFPPGFDINAEGLRTRFPALANPAEARFGDLAIYGAAGKPASHVAFCISPSLMIEAGGGDSSTVSLERASEQGACIRVRPINRRRDLRCIVRPSWAS